MIVITSIESLPDHCYECPCQNGESGYYDDHGCLVEVNNDAIFLLKDQKTARNSISKTQMDSWLKERQQIEWTNRTHEMGE